MAPKLITDNVYWVGAIDYDRRQFHGLSTPHGSTYNSYLVTGEKTALIDCVDQRFTAELLRNVQEVMELSRLDYVVCNHSEPDHSGALPRIKELAPQAQVYGTARCIDMLKGTYRPSWDLHPVKEGDSLDLGNLQLRFIDAPFLHWPDTMFTYLPQRQLLFSCDFLSTHVASTNRFDDEMADFSLESAKYYAYIMRPFVKPVLRGLDKMAGLDLRLVAPSHGPVLRSRFRDLADAYRRWSVNDTREKVTIVYASIWDSTEHLARELASALDAEGIEVGFFNLRNADLAEMLLSAVESRAVVAGSCTIIGGPHPGFYSLLAFLKGVHLEGRLGAAFGSYGWGGGAVAKLSAALQDAGLRIVDAGLDVKLAPGAEEIARCRAFARELVAHVRHPAVHRRPGYRGAGHGVGGDLRAHG